MSREEASENSAPEPKPKAKDDFITFTKSVPNNLHHTDYKPSTLIIPSVEPLMKINFTDYIGFNNQEPRKIEIPVMPSAGDVID